ncbi:MAG: hypothetical protein K2N03_06955 [Muribaculaceae bacterium]|nr:hypothetical protein [Muribaculaceae bacterium]
MNRLFDENGYLNISEIVENHPSYKTIMEDGIVTDSELKEQSERTIKSLRRLQDLCNEEQQSAILDAISEMGVLFTTYNTYQLQELTKDI